MRVRVRVRVALSPAALLLPRRRARAHSAAAAAAALHLVRAGSLSLFTRRSARAQHAACVTDDNKNLFIFGGYDGTKCLNDVWHLDLGSMALRQIEIEAPKPEARSRHTVHIIGGLMHVFGGYASEGKPTANDVFTLDVSNPAGMESVGSGDGEKKKKDDMPDEPDED